MANKQTTKGFRDFIGEEALKRSAMKDIIEEKFRLFGFEPVESSIIELEEFARGDNEADEAVRDMFTLKDRGKRELALRYEFTFQMPRIANNQRLPFKIYQIGSVFRDEPIRKGRLRQFTQCDADVIGSTIKDEAECLALAKEIMDALGIPSKVYINNRKLTNEIMESEGIPENVRKQAITEIDKLDKLTKKQVADNLKKIGAEKLLKIFDNEEAFFEKYAYYKEVQELKRRCKERGIPVEFKPTLARGLSYYNGSVFEVWSEKLPVSLAGGGSYEVNKAQSTGISFGLEPLFILADVEVKRTEVQIISLDEDTAALTLAKKLREKGISTSLMCDKTIKKALEYTNTKKIRWAVIIGEKEATEKKYLLKDMEQGTEKLVSEKEIMHMI